ncbi:MAG TPA: hypothetical protein VMU77_07390, partial [Acidimicrobiales bacterium]|nr:hypothetical protein [Acidimicrobiales bacterium]
PDLETPELLARRIEIKLESGKVQLLGDGITRYQEELTGQPVIRDAIAAGELVLRGAEHRHPSSSVLLQIALNVFNSGGGIDPVKLEPLYLRKADVKIGWETRFAGKPVLGGEVE